MEGLRYHLGPGLQLHHLGLQLHHLGLRQLDFGLQIDEEMEEERRHGQELRHLGLRIQEAERRLREDQQELLRLTSYQPTQWKS